MTERPIIFSAPMVCALLAGRKTQTRRVVSSMRGKGTVSEFGPSDTRGYDWHFRDKGLRWHDVRDSRVKEMLPVSVGDTLWVRETHQFGNTDDGPRMSFRATPDYFQIDAWDGPDFGIGPSFNYDKCPGADFSHWLSDVLREDGPWRSPIHLPRWASRLTLVITDVRLQRLREISRDDAMAEGIVQTWGDLSDHDRATWAVTPAERQQAQGEGGIVSHFYDNRTSVENYALLWGSLHGAGAWDANPFVAAISFDVHLANIDSQEIKAA